MNQRNESSGRIPTDTRDRLPEKEVEVSRSDVRNEGNGGVVKEKTENEKDFGEYHNTNVSRVDILIPIRGVNLYKLN